MDIEVGFRSHIPIYFQLVEQVKGLIAAGELKAGDQLPTVRQLAADLRVNFNTVARAYRILDEAGMISTQQGRGTYVLGPLPLERVQPLSRAALNDLARGFLADAARLGFPAQEAAQAVASLAAGPSTGSEARSSAGEAEEAAGDGGRGG